MVVNKKGKSSLRKAYKKMGSRREKFASAFFAEPT